MQQTGRGVVLVVLARQREPLRLAHSCSRRDPPSTMLLSAGTRRLGNDHRRSLVTGESKNELER